MLILSAITLSLSFMMGAPAPAPMDTDSMPAVQCEEDMPCWDADSMGNGLSNTLEADAWDAVDRAGITTPASSQPLILTYSETVTGQPASLPLGSFSIASNTMPNAFHIFRFDNLYFA